MCLHSLLLGDELGQLVIHDLSMSRRRISACRCCTVAGSSGRFGGQADLIARVLEETLNAEPEDFLLQQGFGIGIVCSSILVYMLELGLQVGQVMVHQARDEIFSGTMSRKAPLLALVLDFEGVLVDEVGLIISPRRCCDKLNIGRLGSLTNSVFVWDSPHHLRVRHLGILIDSDVLRSKWSGGLCSLVVRKRTCLMKLNILGGRGSDSTGSDNLCRDRILMKSDIVKGESSSILDNIGLCWVNDGLRPDVLGERCSGVGHGRTADLCAGEVVLTLSSRYLRRSWTDFRLAVGCVTAGSW